MVISLPLWSPLIAIRSSDALNRYIQRDHPGAVDVRGSAPEHVGVIVNSERTERTGEAFYAPAFGDNSTASVELDMKLKDTQVYKR